MQFEILGALEVREGGELKPLGAYKQRALLAILLQHANRVVTTPRLVELLWGEDAPNSARNTIQVYVSQLRKVLEPEAAANVQAGRVLETHPSGYLLRVGPGQLDLDRFEQLTEAGRRAAAAGDHQQAGHSFREALGLWRGQPYADFISERFAIAERVRLDEMRMRTIEDQVEADLHLGRHADLVGWIESLVAEHPLRERLSGLLMLALYRSGRQAEASDVYQKTRERLLDEQAMEPGPELQSLLRRILNQDPSLDLKPADRAAAAINLPHQLTSFVGRQREIDEVMQLLSGHRLVTLTGAGGVGKTRLALELATRVESRYPDGVWFVELASLADGSLVPQTIVSALGLHPSPSASQIALLVEHLKRRRALLVLDNCEHLVQGVAEVVDSLLKACPDLGVMATSRELLRIGAEAGWRVPSLGAPSTQRVPSLSELRRFEAVELFCDRATSSLGSFTLDEVTAVPVVAICARLEGIPLAIELAAARLRLLSLHQIAGRLEDRLHLLTAGERSASPRHRTLRATIEWSYDLLEDGEKLLFERLSVFAGPFGLSAAEAVVPGGAIASGDVLDLLGRMVDKSLVVVERSGPDPTYRLLETLREFGRERLIVKAEFAEVARRHGEHFCLLAEQARPELVGENQETALAQLTEILDDLRAALTWASVAEPGLGLRATSGLIVYWATTGLIAEGRRWTEMFLELESPADLLAIAFNGAGRLAHAQGDLGAARERYERSLELAERTHDEGACARAQNNIGTVLADQGDFEGARRRYELSLEVLRRVGTPYQVASSLNNLAELAIGVGDVAAARPLAEESVSLFREVGNRSRTAFGLANLARVDILGGDLEEGARHASESVLTFSELGDRTGESFALRVRSELQLKQGRLDGAGRDLASSLSISRALGAKVDLALALEAAVALSSARDQAERSLILAGAAAALREAIGSAMEPRDRARFESLVERATRALSPEAAVTAWNYGRNLSVDAAVDEAIKDSVSAST